MRRLLLLALGAAAALTACQPGRVTVSIQDGQDLCRLTTSARVAADLLHQCGLSLGPADRLLSLGSRIDPQAELDEAPAYLLSVRRAVLLTLETPQGASTIETSALTVGQALSEAGLELYAADRFDPPADTPLEGDLVVRFQPSRPLVVSVDGNDLSLRTAADTVGQALADAGLPLTALDRGGPSEADPLPADGRLHITRVLEVVALTQKAMPYETRTELSADLELDQQALLQGGRAGLAVARTRAVLEDGVQVSSQAEGESIVDPPQDRILGIGTRIVIRTTVVDGVTIEYWRALTVYATYYVPCDANGVCYYYTASRKPVQKGVVAMVHPWYHLFRGQPLYVPGYGFASVEDNNGANVSERWGTYWIDVGYSETETPDWVNKYLTIYFLTPVPANVADTYWLP